MEVFDPRSLGKPVYEALDNLYQEYSKDDRRYETRLKEQKNQAVELYTYLATWGLMRLKAEEYALNKGDVQKKNDKGAGKVDVVEAYFKCLEKLPGTPENLASKRGLNTLKELSAEEYLGLTGLGLTIAQEFSFWATAVYVDVEGEA